jgi:hypothetical protein
LYDFQDQKVPPQSAHNFFQGVRAMHESDTYQAILDEGREAEAKRLILRYGPMRLGPPPEESTTRLTAITENIPRLDRMIDRLFDNTATSWEDLLDTP